MLYYDFFNYAHRDDLRLEDSAYMSISYIMTLIWLIRQYLVQWYKHYKALYTQL